MSKIFEALENAEKQRLRKNPSPFLKPREEKKTSSVLEPKNEKMERSASSLAPDPREEKKSATVMAPRSAPAPEPMVEKKTAPVMAPRSAPAPEPSVEKKSAPVPGPKEVRMERPAASFAPEPGEVKKTAPVVGPAFTPPPVPREEKKPLPVPEPKSGWVIERFGSTLAPEPGEVKRTAPAAGIRPTPMPAPKEEKKASPVLEPKSERMERFVSSPAPEPREEKKTAPPAPEPVVEKKTAPIPGPKEVRVERPAASFAPEPREEKKEPVVEKKSAPVPGPKEVRVERPTPTLVPEPARKERVEKTNVVHKAVIPERPESDRPLVSLSDPGSLGAEQFRKLRTHIFKPGLLDAPKTIMVTSATAGEGKTFVAANLAAGIAHDLHFHALLVDCDLRNPSLSHWFGVQNGHGLSDYLIGKGNLPELLVKTRMDKLMILTGGSAQEKPAELIGSKKMEALVHELKSRYTDRYIILDSTPLLATAEPEVLARLVDAILIVVRAGVTPRETVKQAIASLDPEKIMGFVLNEVEFKSSALSSRYFGSDGYYSKYGYGKKEDEPRTSSAGVSPLRKKSG